MKKYQYAFISCVKTKRDYPCAAKDMYISPLFRYAYAYAMRRVAKDKIYILSAKYGLLPADKKIEPYEKTISNARKQEQKIWSYKILNMMKDYNIPYDANILILAGGGYRKYIENYLPNAKCPVHGLSMGKMLNFYKENK